MTFKGGSSRQWLLGVSAGAMILGLSAAPARAQLAAMRAAAGTIAPPTTVTTANGTPARSASMQEALARQQAMQSRAQAVAAYAASAHSAALAAIKGVPTDGISDHGLNPIAPVRATTLYVAAGAAASSVTANLAPAAVAAANDASGINTWEGAKSPVQSVGSDGRVTVRIDQTQQRALLSWQNFDVSANTALVFNQKDASGAAQQSWTVVNRVVNSASPSRILGSITADGTVLILNSQGVLFGQGSQVNLHSLIASSLELGNFASGVASVGPNQFFIASSIKDRNTAFLQNGLLVQGVPGYKAQILSALLPEGQYGVNSALPMTAEGGVYVYSGAKITADSGGMIILAGPEVVNAGQLSASDGQVSLQGGRFIGAATSTGATGSADPYVRGLVLSSQIPVIPVAPEAPTRDQGIVVNYGVITSRRGYISLGSTPFGTVTNSGLLQATTSVSRNGKIVLTGGTVTLSGAETEEAASGITILPDDNGETIPQGTADSPPNFKASQIVIGASISSYLTTDGSNDIDLLPSVFRMDKNAFIWAPNAHVVIGHDVADGNFQPIPAIAASVTIADKAVIDVSGMKGVALDAAINSVKISPAKQNELRDTPNYRAVSTDGSFTLNGQTLYVDARASGVRSDGVAWVGSPLIEAGSAISQIAVSAANLMTKAGTISIDVGAVTGSTNLAAGSVPTINIAKGALLDISGGWVTYSAGAILTTRLITRDGRVVDIADADPNDDYVGLDNGYTASQPKFGINENFNNVALSGFATQPAYDEGRDAGALAIIGSQIGFAGTVKANAFAGAAQLGAAQEPSAASSIIGDPRKLQLTKYQLPSGGLFRIGSFSGSSGIGLGQDISVSGPSAPAPQPADVATITLSDAMLSQAGLGALMLQTSGAVNFASGSNLQLADGGRLVVDAGRNISFNGTLIAPGGQVAARTYQLSNITAAGATTVGNPFRADDDLPISYGADAALPSPFDITVNGRISVAGKWVNDYLETGIAQGSCWINGGSIALTVAPKVFVPIDGTVLTATRAVDLSGSIRIASGALLDVSAGAYVSNARQFDLSAIGGNISLVNQTTYATLAQLQNNLGDLAGATVSGQNVGFTPLDPTPTSIGVLPSLSVIKQNSVVQFDTASLRGFGFAGGGTFTLVSPNVALGAGGADASVIPLDFLARTGFGTLDITSYRARSIANLFDNGSTRLSSFFETTTFTIGAGQTLDLTQVVLPSVFTTREQQALLNLTSGGDLGLVLKPAVPVSAWYRKAANLALHGLMELDVLQGGTITGAAQASITAPKLYNAGTIAIAGGIIKQIAALPPALNANGLGVASSLSEVFGAANAQGLYAASGINALGLTNADGTIKTNSQLFTAPGSEYFLYFLGRMGAQDGITLASGSSTNLAGTALYNPNAPLKTGGGQYQFGKLIAGGSIGTAAAYNPTSDLTQALFANPAYGFITYPDPSSTSPTPPPILAQVAPRLFTAQSGATIDIRGAQATFDEPVSANDYAPSLQWSDGGTLALRGGGSLAGATILAQGGTAKAAGGTLEWLTPTINANLAEQITRSGFSTLIANGGLTLDGTFNLALNKALIVRSAPRIDDTLIGANAAVKISATQGTDASISAPYIVLASRSGAAQSSGLATGNAQVTFSAGASGMDFFGGLLFDASIAQTTLNSLGDIRLSGVDDRTDTASAAVLNGSLIAAGNLTFDAARVYATTGTGNLQRILENAAGAADTRPPSPYIMQALGASTITFLGTHINSTAPISAGSYLQILANNVVQNGYLAAPLGRIEFGNSANALGSLQFGSSSITLVSGAGLKVPYGTTTDLTQLFFTPGTSSPLTQLPSGDLRMTASTINVEQGGKILGAGGGDIFAYEFVSGTGGSRDVLSRFNSDTFSSNAYNAATGTGYQYADKRQVYALVPTATAQKIALYDPIYAADYGANGPIDLYGTSAGLSVRLDGGNGIAAGDYVLMPAHYALLAGAYRVVANSGAVAPAAGASQVLKDGSIVMGGVYATAGTDLVSSERLSFTLQSQSTLLKYSSIKTTSDTATISAIAQGSGKSLPRLPLDAARVVLDPLKALRVAGLFDMTPATGGRGSEIDILGKDIVLDGGDNAQTQGLLLSNATLRNLNANSLLIGGQRSENADDTTSLAITAKSIAVRDNVDFAVPELLLAVGGANSSLNIRNGAKLSATGILADSRAGHYIIASSATQTGAFDSSGVGSVLRLSNGAQRVVERQGEVAAANANRNTTLNIGNASLTGTSLLLNTNHNFSIADGAVLATPSIAISAANIAFGAIGTINDTVAAKLAQASDLSLTSAAIITFDAGSRLTFNQLSLDAPGLALTQRTEDPVNVTITALDTRISNSSKNQSVGCTLSFATACGTSGNSLTLNTASLTLGSGNFNLYPFDGAVNIAATKGVYVSGAGTLQANKAALSITTPFIIDRAAVLDPSKPGTIASDAITPTGNYTIPVTPDYGFVTSGAVRLSNAASSAIAATGLRAPGARIGFGSAAAPTQSIAIDGVSITATAGIIDLQAQGLITLSGAAALATPGYTRSYSDTASTTTVSAGGGTVNLVSLSGDIAIASSAAISVDNGLGNAGRLNLSASNGAITLAGALNQGVTGTRNAALYYDSGTGSFDLDSFATTYGSRFQGDLTIRSGAGDLALGAGRTLRASSVSLTADGGAITLGGTIDTSGVAVTGLTTAQVNAARVNGGNVGLWGRDGVSVLTGALIDTHTSGYADSDQRQASAGNVSIGIGNTGGAITLAGGATLNLSATRSGVNGNRLIAQTVKDPATLVDKIVYQYVAADTGGTLSLRAPVLTDNNNLVNISLGATVTGAASKQIEGYKTYDLQKLFTDYGYDGIFTDGKQLYLDLTPTGLNILSDTFREDFDGIESVPYFIQNFGISATDQSDLSAYRLRPGVDLVSKGNLYLYTAWNLAAGTLDVARARADGLLTALPELSTRLSDGTPYFAITPGKESQILSDYVSFLYRVGGKASGEAGIINLLSGGKLDIAHSISDGFFTFADKSDAAYINYQLGGGVRYYDLALQASCGTSLNCASVAEYNAIANGTSVANEANTLTINLSKFLTGASESATSVLAPYNPEANSVLALGNNTDPLTGDVGGDALGFAQLFPRLSDGSAAHSSSLRLVAGRDTTASVNPLHVDRAKAGDVVVEGESGYNLTSEAGFALLGKGLDLKLALSGASASAYPIFGLDSLVGTSSTQGNANALTQGSYTSISWGSGTTLSSDMLAAAEAYFAGKPANFITTRGVKTGIAAPLGDMLAFLAATKASFMSQVARRATGYPNGQPVGASLINYGARAAYSRTLVRTGDGSIDVAASGNIDLRNGETATYRNENGVNTSAANGAQVGGTAIYTAGVRVSAAPVMATLVSTGTQISLAPSSAYTGFSAQDASFLPSPKGYDDQAAVLASGGGAISLNAGGSLLARRDVWSETYLGRGASYGQGNLSSYSDSAIGDASQRWRVGSVGQDTEIRIAPKYFTSGIGTLAGGNVAIATGGAVQDLTLALDSATTTTTTALGTVAMTLGKGDLSARIGGNLQAGQFDIASGAGRIEVGGNVTSYGKQPGSTLADSAQYLRIRLTQSNIDLSARGSIALGGVSALGAARNNNDLDRYNQAGFFKSEASFSATAIGNLAYINNRLEQTVPFQIGAGGAGGFAGAVLPPSLSLTSLTGSLTAPTLPLLLYPSKQGNLQLYSAGDITGLIIAMSDSDASLLPGQFSAAQISLDSLNSTGAGNVRAQTGLGFGLPGAGPTTSDYLLRLYHNQNTTHAGDTAPVLIHAGNDLSSSLINLPKAALISAGRDISDLFFTGQNANAADTTVISAGRDITGSTASSATLNLPYIVSNNFTLGGAGALVVEAGRDIGPFINSATVKNVSYAGGIQTTGNFYNPWLASGGADLTLMFGIANGVQYAALRDTYLDPANFAKLDGALFEQTTDSLGNTHPDRSKPIYAPILAAWLLENAPERFAAIFGTSATDSTALATAAYGKTSALYAAFAALDPLLQNQFLLKVLLFTELQKPAEPDGPSYLQYVRGYRAIQTLFPASAGYTDNLAVYTVNASSVNADHPLGVPTRKLVDGQPQKAETISTGNADLRLATLQTADGGDLTLISPGGNFVAGSVVRTSTQAAGRLTRFGVDQTASLAYGQLTNTNIARINAIPIGYEGLLTLNGGAIRSFTDGNFLVNQSRVFTQAGGDIVMWSSNGDLNAGQGPRSASNFPPVTVKFNLDGYAVVDSAGSVSGAGIGAFQRRPTDPASSIILVAPAGLVDAGDAGVRATGNVLVAAARVANADSFSAGGAVSGVPAAAATPATSNPAASSSAVAAQSSGSQANNDNSERRSIITVEVLGYVGGSNACDDGGVSDPECRKKAGT